ncbi:gamma-glutamyl hydrolase-like [Palaemon carinicauda]|uniref:gamma-glutamyl hydrolase-like n=1 Tax=Palaemon carinicauda TaxID=392227 RepID=UPI0035B580D7
MNSKILCLILLFFLSTEFGDSRGDTDINLRPIIGILSQEPPDDLLELLPDQNYTSFIDACYIKYIESAGGRAVPILINQDTSYYEYIASSVNGILFPGGDVSMTNSSGYGMAGQTLYELAVEAYIKGAPLPVWGTCLGQEMILYLAGGQTDWMTSCQAENKADFLNLQPEHEHSRLFRFMPDRIKNFLEYENATVNFHEYCSTPEI